MADQSIVIMIKKLLPLLFAAEAAISRGSTGIGSAMEKGVKGAGIKPKAEWRIGKSVEVDLEIGLE